MVWHCDPLQITNYKASRSTRYLRNINKEIKKYTHVCMYTGKKCGVKVEGVKEIKWRKVRKRERERNRFVLCTTHGLK